MKFGHLGIAGILALGSSFSHAATPVFFDDFNSYAMDQIPGIERLDREWRHS
jgi:hypothetical protein